MQSGAAVVKNQLWSNLEVFFNQYKKENGEIPTGDLDKFITDVIKESDRSERDYILKNLWRLDSDQSGTVSLIELGNFLFKRHAGEISLQRQHKKGVMAHGKQYKMNVKEFGSLLNLAFKFLNVTVPAATAEQIFQKAGLDNDGLITYVEYFKVIQVYACRTSKEDEQRKRLQEQERLRKEKQAKAGQGNNDRGKLRNCRLRRFVWDCLRRAYNLYVKDRSLTATEEELRGLILFILEDLSQNELDSILTGLIAVIGGKPLVFQTFAPYFLIFAAQIGIGRWSINRDSSVRKLSKNDMFLLNNSFGFCDFNAINKDVLFKVFGSIDVNNDGDITYEQYMDWVRKYLAELQLYGQGYYVIEDDEDIENSLFFQAPPKSTDVKKVVIKFTFSDYTFAKAVRERVWDLLIPFDADKNEQFNKQEIQGALVGLLKENQNELRYVTRNVFRYDRNNDGEVTYHELTNFCTQQHFGEMAIQRLHRKQFYSEGYKRRMNQKEFGHTINHALDFIQMQATEDLISDWFSVLDITKDGWISYQVYFLFLRYYFGGASIAALETLARSKKTSSSPLNEDHKFILSLRDLNPFQRFSRTIIDQLKEIFYRFDYNKNRLFQYDQVKDILEQVFQFESNELSYILSKYFSFDAANEGSVTFQELIALILTIYFTEIVFKRKYGNQNSINWKTIKISLDDFIELFTEFCFFIKIKPTRQDLIYIFRELDTDNDGFITFQQYLTFVRKYLGNGIDLDSSRFKAQAPNDIPAEELAFVNAIWDELKVYFDKYDQGAKGFLVETELKAFVVEVLQETTQRELDYVFWNLFRVDSNSNKEVDFLEFAPFILRHAGEISLQRFHRQQQAGKSNLSCPEFYRVIGNAYSFLSSIPKEKNVIEGIFKRIKTADNCGYANFLNWIHLALASKYKK